MSEELPQSEWSPEIKRWFRQVRAPAGVDPRVLRNNTLEIEGSGSGQFHLMNAPPGWHVVIRNTETNRVSVQVGRPASAPPDSITIESPSLTDLGLSGKVPSVRLRLKRNEVALQLNEEPPDLLVVDDGFLNYGGPKSPLPSLELINAGFISNGRQASRVTLMGRCSIDQLRIAKTSIVDNAQLDVAGEVWLGEVTFEDTPPALLLMGDGALVRIRSLPAKTELTLGTGQQQISVEIQDPLKDVTFVGTGRIICPHAFEGPTFNPSNYRSLSLTLGEAAVATDVKGSLALNAGKGSVLLGDREKPPHIDRVISAEGAELDGISLYRLSIDDLPALDQAERVQPWMPSRHKARKLENEMTLGGGSPRDIRGKQAHFWSRIAVLLRAKHASGAIQSKVRYAQLRARMRASRRNHERLLLSAYWLIGFGERILQPITTFAVIAALLVNPIHFPKDRTRLLLEPHGFFEDWLNVFFLPLTFFRVVEGGSLGMQPLWAVAVAKIAGVILIGFALLAMRRIVKAE